MSTPRRRLVRPPAARPVPAPEARQLQKLRARLDREYLALRRWQKCLNLAFNAFTKHQRSIARLQNQLGKREGP